MGDGWEESIWGCYPMKPLILFYILLIELSIIGFLIEARAEEWGPALPEWLSNFAAGVETFSVGQNESLLTIQSGVPVTFSYLIITSQ